MGETEPSFTPGEILNDELEARGWSEATFAAAMGRTIEETSAILDDQAEITAGVAADIGSAFGTGSDLWLNLQEIYRDRYLDTDPRPVPA